MEEYNHIKEKINEYSKEEQLKIVEDYWGKMTEEYTQEQIDYIIYTSICKKEIDEFCKMREEERKKAKNSCKIGDTYYEIVRDIPIKKKIKTSKDLEYVKNGIGVTHFLTKEECKNKIKDNKVRRSHKSRIIRDNK